MYRGGGAEAGFVLDVDEISQAGETLSSSSEMPSLLPSLAVQGGAGLGPGLPGCGSRAGPVMEQQRGCSGVQERTFLQLPSCVSRSCLHVASCAIF